MDKCADVSGLSADITALVSDSDAPSDDSSSWMTKIDVSNFEKLTSANAKRDSNSVGSNESGTHDQHTIICMDHDGYIAREGQPFRAIMDSPGDDGEPTDNARPQKMGSVNALAMLTTEPSSTGPMLGSAVSLCSSFPSPADSAKSPNDYHDIVINRHYHRDQQRALYREDKEAVTGQGKALTPLFSYINTTTANNNNNRLVNRSSIYSESASVSSSGYAKPTYSYSCLIALALKNSRQGRLTVAEIYNFMCENFPHFRTAPPGWKNSVRHNLSLNKCFQKYEIETPGNHGRKSCLWSLNPQKIAKMDQEIKKWRERDPIAVKESLTNPDDLEAIESGKKGVPSDLNSFSMMTDSFNGSHPPLLLVKTSQLQNLNRYGVGGKWFGSGAKFGRLSVPVSAPPGTPPKQNVHHHQTLLSTGTIIGESASQAAAKNLQFALAQRSPGTFAASPLRTTSAASQHHMQSSPYSHTPPYSPTHPLHGSPSHLPPVYPYGQQHVNPHNTSPYYPVHNSPSRFAHVNYSPCHQQVNSYEMATSAINNNSLLQSALEPSPCKPAPLTFQSL